MGGFTLLVERRRIMLASVAAWHWLNNDCVNHILSVIAHLQDSSLPSPPNNWLSSLTTQIHRAVINHVPLRLEAADFLPHLESSPRAADIVPRRNASASLAESVCGYAVTVVRGWLNFPSNTEMLAAYFVLYVLQTAHNNPDILLLHGLWKPYRSIKASVLRCPSWTKHSSLRIDMLDAFAAAIRNIPLANASSEEAQLLTSISAAVHRCDPAAHVAVAQLAHPLLHADSYALSASVAAHSATVATNPAAGPSLSGQEKGLRSLTDFILELSPLVATSSPPTQLTPLQKLVLSDMDRYSPFREHGPSRQRVTSAGGPFHSLNINKPGAFPSALAFRGLLFSSWILRHRTYGLFEDINDWQAFLDIEGYDPSDKQSTKRFFVERAYGTPQHNRTLHAATYAKIYFEKQPEWRILQNAHADEVVPFMEFLNWSQEKTGWFDDDGFKHSGGRFPLIGPLTGYLLAADLAYAGAVMHPTIQEVGGIIRRNGLGSLGGLVSLNQVADKGVGVGAVEDAVARCFLALSENLCDEVRAMIGFDAIMLEHALCKYGRCMRTMSM